MIIWRSWQRHFICRQVIMSSQIPPTSSWQNVLRNLRNFKKLTKAFYLQASNRVKPDSPGRGATPSCLPPATFSQKEKKTKLKTKYLANTYVGGTFTFTKREEDKIGNNISGKYVRGRLLSYSTKCNKQELPAAKMKTINLIYLVQTTESSAKLIFHPQKI